MVKIYYKGTYDDIAYIIIDKTLNSVYEEYKSLNYNEIIYPLNINLLIDDKLKFLETTKYYINVMINKLDIHKYTKLIDRIGNNLIFIDDEIYIDLNKCNTIHKLINHTSKKRINTFMLNISDFYDESKAIIKDNNINRHYKI